MDRLPDVPGVYFFIGEKKSVLYIGKATSLRDRVASYFSQDIAQTRGPKIVRMLEIAKEVKWRATDSVLEALLLESRLIKQYQPPYNTDEKDDKSFFFAVITKEAFPRILLLRGRDREKRKNLPDIRYAFGPFPSGGALKEALKIIRKIFPFRDKCVPLSGKPCFHAQIGLCPGVCAGSVTAKEYAKTVRRLRLFFEGKKKSVTASLEREMMSLAKKQEFEKAAQVKKALFALAHIHDVALLKKEYPFESSGEGGGNSFRLEAYDVAHLSGGSVVGVMTVVQDGIVNPSEYRKFILKTQRNDDVKSLREILARRFKHTDWRFPDAVVVDGSDAQLRVAREELRRNKLVIPVVGVVKDAHHKPKGIIGNEAIVAKHRDAVLLANAQAHRFAISFHRARRSKKFLTPKVFGE